MVFCNITNELIDTLISLVHGRLVVDCGAGECMLERSSQGRLRVLSLDLYPKEATKPSVDCTKMTFHEGMVPVFIRPSHGGWVEETIANNQENVHFFLYIGLEQNLDQDLGEYRESAYLVSDWVGDEGERVYRVNGLYQGDAVEDYFLIGSEFIEGKWWVKGLNDEFYENISGGQYPVHGTPIYGTAKAAGFQELDWSKTYLVTSEDGAGWLDREARFFGCPKEEHDTYAHLVLRKEVGELEQQGWVRVENETEFRCIQRLSAEQENWLSAKGYLISD